MTKVTITFTVTEDDYNDYEDILDTFLNDLDQIAIDTEVQEEEV